MAGFVCSAVFVGQQSANTFLCEENRVSVDFVKSRRAATNAASYRVVGTRPLEVFMCDAQPPTEGTRFQRWVGNRKKLASRLREYGLAAVISYGLFDAVTYAVSLFLAIRGYLAAGKVLTLQSAPQVFLAMWGINNFSRPLRVSGALAIAPFVNRRVVEPLRTILKRRK